MTLSLKDIDTISNLAMIAIDETERDASIVELSTILEFVEQIQTVDTDAIAPLAHPFDATQPLRDDVVSENNTQADAENLSEHIESHLYAVPKVIE